MSKSAREVISLCEGRNMCLDPKYEGICWLLVTEDGRFLERRSLAEKLILGN